ncbi:hypothetical protein G4D61_11175 [Bacillus ginsengihumi]|uniref:Uncharacterized protein n=2 Tax=Heyndrickxia ginsengihumi TaxID=363870 RepID=A0A6M0P7M9_9BACI|nr:hypothetical protein [Heyndrickxia ginsengihumi]NEY20517.1 hypothetical protein [Heyndrickxia ginsengihumi]
MGKDSRKREQPKQAVSTLNVEIMKAYNAGYKKGAQEQRLADFKKMMSWIESLQEIYGVGERTQFKIGHYFLRNFTKGDSNATS